MHAGVVPDVVGLNHQLAQDTMQAAGFSQQPTGGTRAAPDTKIVLRAKKIGE